MAKSKATNGNHRGAGNGAPGAQSSSIKTTPTKPKPTAAKPKTKEYGVKDGNNAKGRTKRLMSALDSLKVKSGPTPPKKNTSNRGAGNGAPGASSAVSRASTPKKKPAQAKPTATKKPLTVPTNKIPKNLNSPEGRKYIADLDAGKLTRRK